MSPPLTRRHFLHASAAATGTACLPRWTHAGAPASGATQPFSFILLGDLHFDRLEHHDMDWVRRDKPHDVSQIENYSRITRDLSPRLFQALRETIAELGPTAAAPVTFALQAGDLVEGLCGHEELSTRQNTEALEFIRDSRLGVPLVFIKGNHDITGPGAAAAFRNVFHPFLTTQVQAISPTAAPVTSARYSFERGNALFACFDAYEPVESLEWLEAVAQRRTAEHFFVAIHPPVVPYGARATWHLFASDRERSRRERLLEILGDQRALVLGGHIHRYCALARASGHGRFAQFALSSVLPAAEVRPKTELAGLPNYTPDQIRVEPNFSPETAPARRAVLEAERPQVRDFAYADLPGYAVVTVAGAHVTARMYSGASRHLWRTVDLSSLARG
jgi:hypothetical protein